MAKETYSFDQARVRLEEIAAQVRKKDTSLEKSLDLLEEGVRLANLCTEQIDQTQWKSVLAEAEAEAAQAAAGDAEEPAEPEDGTSEAEPDAADPQPDEAADASDADGPAGAAGMEADDDVPAEYAGAASEEPPADDAPDVEA